MAIDWVFSEELKDGEVPIRRYHKPLIKVGKYTKDSDGVDFEVTDDLLSHWNNTVLEMSENGIKIPVPLGHTENNKGYLKSTFIKDKTLIGVIDLVVSDAEELSKTLDVSIFVPPKFTDGKGRIYNRPIRHVALTSYPVIPGLGEFEAVAASLIPIDKEKEMELGAIKLALNIEGEATEDSILAGITKLKESIPIQLSFNDATIKVATENRELKIGQLINTGKITPAVGEELKKIYTTKDNITLSLSSEDSTFDKMVEALSKNEAVVKTGEKTGQQTLELSDPHKGGDERNYLIEDAEKRQKAGV